MIPQKRQSQKALTLTLSHQMGEGTGEGASAARRESRRPFWGVRGQEVGKMGLFRKNGGLIPGFRGQIDAVAAEAGDFDAEHW